MPKAKSEKSGTTRKNYGLRLNRDLMLEIQHIALDRDCYVNDLIEEALTDIVKKYREKKKAER